MDRSQRWTAKDGKFDSAPEDGRFVDVPSVYMFAALLSAPPPSRPGGLKCGNDALRPAVPKRLVTLDIHDDLKPTTSDPNSPVPNLEMALTGWSNVKKASATLMGGVRIYLSKVGSRLCRSLLL